MYKKSDPILDFGKFAGYRVSQTPQHYLAWIVGYSGIGSTDLTLPKEQTKGERTGFRYSRPEVYFAALNELVARNRCLACDGQLVPFKTTTDWRTRLLHKKCYEAHVESCSEYVPDD